MSKYVIYINLEKYLAEWAVSHFGNPVTFPPQSHGNAVIRTYLQKLPKGTMPDIADGVRIPIAIPDSKAKPAEIYNHMGTRGKDAVREVLKDLFKRNLWADLSPIEGTNVGLNTRISAWCEMHGIDLDRVDTVRKIYDRLRDAHKRIGINLRENTKKMMDKSDQI